MVRSEFLKKVGALFAGALAALGLPATSTARPPKERLSRAPLEIRLFDVVVQFEVMGERPIAWNVGRDILAWDVRGADVIEIERHFEDGGVHLMRVSKEPEGDTVWPWPSPNGKRIVRKYVMVARGRGRTIREDVDYREAARLSPVSPAPGLTVIEPMVWPTPGTVTLGRDRARITLEE